MYDDDSERRLGAFLILGPFIAAGVILTPATLAYWSQIGDARQSRNFESNLQEAWKISCDGTDAPFNPAAHKEGEICKPVRLPATKKTPEQWLTRTIGPTTDYPPGLGKQVIVNFTRSTFGKNGLEILKEGQKPILYASPANVDGTYKTPPGPLLSARQSNARSNPPMPRPNY